MPGPPQNPPPLGSAAWLAAMLRERLGPRAELGTVAWEGRLLHVEGAILPIGPDAALHVARASIEAGAGLSIGVLPISIRLVALRGEIKSPGISLPLDFAGSGEGAPAWARGTLRIGPAGALPGRIALPGAVAIDLVADGPMPRSHVRGRISGAPIVITRRVPLEATLSGELSVSPSGSVSGTFVLETPRSEIALRLAIDPGGSLLGSTLRGRFAGGDGIAVGLFGGPVVPRAADVFTLDARLTGTVGRMGLVGRLASASTTLSAGPAMLHVDDASVLLDVGPEGFAWSALAGRFYGGSFTSSGRMQRETDALSATVAFQGVRVDEVPTGPSGESAVAALITGAASGEVRFERAGLTEHALSASGRISVADPLYLLVRRFAPVLARYGLPPIARRGRGPLTASVRLAHGEIVVEPIAAAVDGIDVDGELRVGEGGRLLGRARIHLGESYLSRSRLLSIPAALAGRVTIPVYVRGLPGSLVVRTDALEILDGLVAQSRAGGAVKSVLDGLFGLRRR